jgi:DNA polymerase III gamma/tau subunit
LTGIRCWSYLGAVPEEFYIELTEKVVTHNISDALFLLDQALKEGKDVKQMMKDWMAHYRNLLITQFVSDPEDMLNMSTGKYRKAQGSERQDRAGGAEPQHNNSGQDHQ